MLELISILFFNFCFIDTGLEVQANNDQTQLLDPHQNSDDFVNEGTSVSE